MKKLKLAILFIIITGALFFSNNVLAADETTKCLYQDITVNRDGSITIKEAAWLNGEYNGRLRDIDFKNYRATTFTGIYSNFAGNTDIYNGTAIKDITVYDISQENFKSIEDINKIENIYKQVNKASNGKYGVYELNSTSSNVDFKIFCPDNKKKVICMQYTVTDAVVVHNDVAELYWNVLGEYFEEDIQDFQVLIHLPNEDDDVRIWTHGPLTGKNKIIDERTLYFQDKNVNRYTPETIRIMFNKNLVPLATKQSSVNGRENILKYEAMMADTANSERENEKLLLENKASQAVLDLEDYLTMYNYNRAVELVNELDDTSEEKDNFLSRIAKTKNKVNENWQKDLKYNLEILQEDNYKFLNRSRLEHFKEDISEGFDEHVKADYLEIYTDLEKILQEKEAKLREGFKIFVIAINSIIGIIALYKLIKLIKERYKFKEKYYRDFPSDDDPNIIEYLMKRKSTNIGFSATILNLINKKVITYKKDANDNDIILMQKNKEYKGNNAEKIVLSVLFKVIGQLDRCSLKELKKYGKSTTSARTLVNKMNSFKKTTKKEAEAKGYFNKNTTSVLYIIVNIINYILSICMAFGVFYNLSNFEEELLLYLLVVTIINGICIIIGCKDKNRTNLGQEEYSKWLAHKRFLKDFSNFDEKDLPDITLWDKYLVTATVLGCADKVEKKMKLVIPNTDTVDTNLLIYQSVYTGITKEINNSVRSAISNSSSNTGSSYSSGGGFGGGSSIGGGRWWPEAAAEAVSKNRKIY